jgi:RNA polymerase sigma-70 factor (ECF subfamily)
MKLNQQVKIEEGVIRKFAAGDSKAFDLLYFHFCNRLHRFVFSLVKIETETEGIVQEVFIKVWENRTQLKKHASFESFLFTVAYNATMSHLRKKATEVKYIEYIKSIQIEAIQPLIDEKLDLDEFNQTLNEVINKLPDRQQQVFKLKHFEDYSYKQIAEKLQISINTVENHMVKSHRFLKQNLKENYASGLLLLSLFF